MSPTSPEPEHERGAEAGRVRVAVVGLGWAGRSIWLPRLREHPGYEVVALVDPDPVIRAELDSTGPVGVFAHPDQLSRHDVDLAVVAVPNHLHCPIAAGLLEAGISVFVEKPVCLSTAEADRLAVAERAGGAVLLAGSAACLRADLRALYTLAGQLGTIRHVDVSWVRAHGVPDAGAGSPGVTWPVAGRWSTSAGTCWTRSCPWPGREGSSRRSERSPVTSSRTPPGAPRGVIPAPRPPVPVAMSRTPPARSSSAPTGCR
nr:Gfo/Idh/MocA family oxidoreductase [Parafrankia sp. CH37]